MNWLVDAQLPRRLAVSLNRSGENAVHTLELPLANGTPDSDIIRIADLENRIVVTKDHDFVNSFLLHGKPKRLLLISTGNITNADLVLLVEANLARILAMFVSGTYIELNRHHLILHG